ncbi:MAG: cyclic nucleotide-binding domain-containing protein [bacterium]
MDEIKPDTDYQWILRPGKAAVKRKESHFWHVVENFEHHKGMKFGLALSLARSDSNFDDDPSSSHCIVKIPCTLPGCSVWCAWIIISITFLIIMTGLVKNYAGMMNIPSNFMNTWSDLYMFLCAIVSGYVLSVIWEALVVINFCQGGEYIFGFGGLLVAVEHVVWRLGLPIIASFFSLIMPFFGIMACWIWLAVNPVVLAGCAIGCWLYLLVALFPLHPGPASLLAEKLLNSEDLPHRLKWALASRFLPLGQTIETGRGRAMAWAALSLALWVAWAGASFRYLSERAAMELSLVGFIVNGLISFVALCFIGWLIYRIKVLFHAAYLLRGQKHLYPLTPSDSDLKDFNERLALLTHLPELRNLEWKWCMAPAGTFLIRYGERERIFYWLSYGEAIVLARTPEGDVKHVATLTGGTGVGEIAFLDDEPRTADVLITKSALVASITYEQFSSVVQGALSERFREFVLAGQAFEQSTIFSGIPDTDKQSWITHGIPVRYEANDIIIEADVNEQWMALLVAGEVEVIRDGETLDTLKTGNVCGEIAFLDDRPRTATLRAVKRALLWRWDPEWLNSEVDRLGLRPALEALSQKRQEG